MKSESISRQDYINYLEKLIFILIISAISSCANQLPPSGGENDIIPPKIINTTPEANTINYRDKKIIFEFDKYVDRRSFEESFFISPKPKGKINFDWSAKSVSVEFENSFDIDKTYNITIGTNLKDVRAGNKLKSPIRFAFSTGNKIDMGGIEGKVYSKNLNDVIITGYNLYSRKENEVNPEKDLPDYYCLINADGSYNLGNISEGKYRLFAIRDKDKNFLYDKDFEEIALLHNDYSVKDSSISKEANFLMYAFDFNPDTTKFIESFTTDSSAVVFSSLKNNSVNIPVFYKFYFYFKNRELSRYDYASGIDLKDTVKNINIKIIYNWITDSLLEIIPSDRLEFSSAYSFNYNLSFPKKVYNSKLTFTTAEEKKFSKISGNIFNIDKNDIVIVQLIDNSDPLNTYSLEVRNDSVYKFNYIFTADYYLFSFIDENGDNVYNKGTYFPYKPSERFFLSENILNVRGRIDYDNVFIKFY